MHHKHIRRKKFPKHIRGAFRKTNVSFQSKIYKNLRNATIPVGSPATTFSNAIMQLLVLFKNTKIIFNFYTL